MLLHSKVSDDATSFTTPAHHLHTQNGRTHGFETLFPVAGDAIDDSIGICESPREPTVINTHRGSSPSLRRNARDSIAAIMGQSIIPSPGTTSKLPTLFFQERRNGHSRRFAGARCAHACQRVSGMGDWERAKGYGATEPGTLMECARACEEFMCHRGTTTASRSSSTQASSPDRLTFGAGNIPLYLHMRFS